MLLAFLVFVFCFSEKYHCTYRFYDTKVGKFLQPDEVAVGSTAQQMNRFTYVHNSPMKFIDPSGHVPHPPSQDPASSDIFDSLKRLSGDALDAVADTIDFGIESLIPPRASEKRSLALFMLGTMAGGPFDDAARAARPRKGVFSLDDIIGKNQDPIAAAGPRQASRRLLRRTNDAAEPSEETLRLIAHKKHIRQQAEILIARIDQVIVDMPLKELIASREVVTEVRKIWRSRGSKRHRVSYGGGTVTERLASSGSYNNRRPFFRLVRFSRTRKRVGEKGPTHDVVWVREVWTEEEFLRYRNEIARRKQKKVRRREQRNLQRKAKREKAAREKAQRLKRLDSPRS